MNAFALVKGRAYWLRHRRYGTHEAVLVLASPNQRSLAFQLRSPVATRQKGGILFQANLPLLHDPVRGYVDFFTNEPWELLDRDPGYSIATAESGEQSITCHTCCLTSHNPNDVLHRCCGKCHHFHEAPGG